MAAGLFLLRSMATTVSRQLDPQVAFPSINLSDFSHRAQAIAEARLAWRARPREISAANLRAEHRFLNRVINLMSRTRKNEAYAEACNLWNECCGDHLFAYPEDRAL